MPEFLYIHIPFCIRKCIYCDFLSFAYDESLAKRYVNALCKELELKKGYAGILKTIYIGGGTPSVLPEESLRQLFKCTKDNFDISSSAEITIEANPGTINESKINTLLSLGVNRLSIGVQSFNDDELKTLGRIHTSEDAVKSIEMIKKAGISNFSIDLMYGVPGQTINTWEKSLSKAVRFSPTHLSSYELTPEKGTPLYEMIMAGENTFAISRISNPPTPPFSKGGEGGFLVKGERRNSSDRHRGIIKMPPEDLILDMYNYAIDFLSSKSYEHYEISNFAKSGFKCLHNLNYWDRGEYVGAGAGAHSFIRGFRSGNTDDLRRYIEDLGENKIPEIESGEISCEDAIKEFIFLGLRKTEGISISKAEELSINILDASKELIADSFTELKDNHFRLTRKGIVIANEIIAKLFEKLELD